MNKVKTFAKDNLQTCVLGATFLLMQVQTVFASDLISTIDSGAQTIYSDIVKISTPIAAAAIVIALVMSMLSQNEKRIDQCRHTAVGVGVVWLIINGLGYILVYAQSLLGDGGKVSFGS